MARFPAKQEKTIIIREVSADTFTSPLDYWLETDMLRRQCDELRTIWIGPARLSLAEQGLDALRNTVFKSQDDYDAIFAALKRLADLEAVQDSPRENI